MSHTTKARLVLDVEYRGIEKDFNKIFEPIRYKYIGRLVKSLNVTVQESQTTEHPAVPDLKLQELNQHKRIAKKILELAGYNVLRGKKYKNKQIELHKSVSHKVYRAYNTAGAFDQAIQVSEDKLANIKGSKCSREITEATEGPEMQLYLSAFPKYTNVIYTDFPWDRNSHINYKIEDMQINVSRDFGLTIRDTKITLWNKVNTTSSPVFAKILSIDMHDPNSFQTMADFINLRMDKAIQTKIGKAPLFNASK